MLWVLLLIIIIIILIIWLLQIIDVLSNQFHPLTFSSETPLLIFQTFFSSYSSIIYDIMFLSIISSSSSHSPPWKAVRLFIQNSARTKQAVKVAVRGGKTCSCRPLFHFTISNFSLSPLLGGNYLPHIGLVVDIFGAPIQFLNISPPTIWNGTSVRQHRCGFPAWRWQNISLAFKIYFRNFIFFYFQNEKDQILTTNIWLNLVSTFVSSKNFRIRQYCSTAKIHQHSFSSFQ